MEIRTQKQPKYHWLNNVLSQLRISCIFKINSLCAPKIFFKNSFRAAQVRREAKEILFSLPPRSKSHWAGGYRHILYFLNIMDFMYFVCILRWILHQNPCLDPDFPAPYREVTYLLTYIHTWLLACLLAYILAYIRAYLLSHLLTTREIPGVLYLLSYPLKTPGRNMICSPHGGGLVPSPFCPFFQFPPFPPFRPSPLSPMLFVHPEPPRRQFLHIYTQHPSDPIFP